MSPLLEFVLGMARLLLGLFTAPYQETASEARSPHGPDYRPYARPDRLPPVSR
jgi:hypothetical protein